MTAKSLNVSSLAHDNIPHTSEQPAASASTSTRQFMSSGSMGPRPLHLALGSVVATSTPSSPSASSNIRISNDPGADSEAETSASAWNLTQQLSSSGGPSPLPASPTVTNTRKEASARKRSSITYLPPNLQSPTYLQTNRHEVSSPLSSSHTRASFIVEGASPGLARSSSLGGRGAKTPRSATFERSSSGSILNSSDPNIANGVEHLKERPPVTLAEKHADLLHFIAQKESKCLELRSQLAVHEAELLQLKKKWERIVNRGFERALGPTSASSTPSPYFSAPSSSPAHLESSTSSSAAYFPTLNPNNTNATGAVMLEGIKGGVQGVSRLIAAGLGSITQVNVAPADQSPRTPRTPDSAAATVQLPIHLGSLSQRNRSGHGQKESQSSSSTVASHATTSSSLSASTTSSATSASSTGMSGNSMSEDTTKTLPNGHASNAELDTESDFGDFEDGKAHGSRTRSSTLTEHLIVEDTGATPMMSPNPRFQRRKLNDDNAPVTGSSRNSASRTGDASAGGNLLLSAQDRQQESDVSNEDFDWGDGWDEPASEAQAADKYASTSFAHFEKATPGCTASDSESRPDSNSTLTRTARAYKGEGGLRSPLAPMSSIPGLGAMGMGVSTPTTQQMSSWVGSVGKKWDEIKGSSTFTKSQKRASVLLSDIQESFISSLIAPSPISDTSTSPITAASSVALSPNTPRNPLVSDIAKAPVSTQPTGARREMSLLDDSDDESFGESGEDANATVRMLLTPNRMSAPVLVPVAMPRKTAKVAKTNEVAVNSSTDEDEWNW